MGTQPAEWEKAFDNLPADATPAIVRALKIYREEVRVMNMRTVKRDVPFMPLAIEEGCTARNNEPDGQSLVTDHLSVAWISESSVCVSFTLTSLLRPGNDRCICECTSCCARRTLLTRTGQRTGSRPRGRRHRRGRLSAPSNPGRVNRYVPVSCGSMC